MHCIACNAHGTVWVVCLNLHRTHIISLTNTTSPLAMSMLILIPRAHVARPLNQNRHRPWLARRIAAANIQNVRLFEVLSFRETDVLEEAQHRLLGNIAYWAHELSSVFSGSCSSAVSASQRTFCCICVSTHLLQLYCIFPAFHSEPTCNLLYSDIPVLFG